MRQRGFTIIEIVITIAIVAILAGVGFVAYNNFAMPKATHTSTHTPDKSSDHDMNAMSAVDSTKDLDEAAVSLDDASFEDDGLSEINRQSADF